MKNKIPRRVAYSGQATPQGLFVGKGLHFLKKPGYIAAKEFRQFISDAHRFSLSYRAGRRKFAGPAIPAPASQTSIIKPDARRSDLGFPAGALRRASGLIIDVW